MKRRDYLLLGSTTLAGSLAFGSGAFSQARLERDVEVVVVDDSDAYLTLRYPQSTQSFGCKAELNVTVQNQTSQSLDTVTVRFSTGVGSIDTLTPNGPGEYSVSRTTVSLARGSLDPGQSVVLTATVNGFTGNGTTDFSFGVTAAGDSIAITTASDRTVELDYNCPRQFGSSLAACPLSPAPSITTPSVSPSVTTPSVSVPASDCADLEFDQGVLQDVQSSIDFSQGPGAIRSDLNSKSGIDITRRVLSNSVDTSRIKEIQANPSTLVLGGSNHQVRIGTTQGANRAVIPGEVKLKNDSTVVGALDVGGKFTLKGRSAVAGDVTTETVGEIKNSLLLGSLSTDKSGNSLSIGSSSLICGEVDAAGPVSQIKQSRINGALTAGGNISEINESTVVGDVTTEPGSNGDVTIKQQSLVDGMVDADGNISGVTGSEVSGALEADGDISSIKQSTVGGDVATKPKSDGNVTVQDSTVDGSVTADGGVSAVKSSSKIRGDVTAGGDIPELKNSTVTGKVKTTDGSGGSMTIEDATVGGNVEADDTISAIKSTSEINGDVTANGNISEIGGKSKVGGDVTTKPGSNGKVKIKESTVGGSVDADGKISAIKSNSEIGGSIDAGGNISELKESKVGGSVTTTDGGSVTVKNSTVGGRITIDGMVETLKASEVGGTVEADDIDQLQGVRVNGNLKATDGTNSDITITRNNRTSVICGNVETPGSVEKIKNSEVNGTVSAARIGKLKGDKTKIGGNVETTDSTADLRIKGGSTVYGSVDAAGPIPELSSSTVKGSLIVGGKVKIKNGNVCTTAGSLETNGGKVNVKDGSTIGGSIDAGGPIEKITGGSTVKGSVTSVGDARIKGGSTVEGFLKTKSGSGGVVAIVGSGTVVEGFVDADGKVQKIKDAVINGPVESSGPIEKIKSANVGDVTAAGNVKIKNSETGSVTTTSGGNLILKGSSTVDGEVVLDGNVTKIKSSTVRGDVIVGGSVDKIKDSTIDGTVEADGDILLKGSTTVTGNVISHGGNVIKKSEVTVQNQ